MVSGDDADRYRLVVVPDAQDGVDVRRRGIWLRCGGDRVVDGHLMVDQVGDAAEGFDRGVDASGIGVVDEVVEALVQGREPDPFAADAKVGGDDRAAVDPVPSLPGSRC